MRAFDSDDVVHVECLIRQRTAPRRGPFSSKCSCVLNDHDQCNRQEQVRDLETIQAELCLKDLQVHAKVPRLPCSTAIVVLRVKTCCLRGRRVHGGSFGRPVPGEDF